MRENREGAKGYIADKLALPKLAKLRGEVLGGVEHMRWKFCRCLELCPEQLQTWIGEAAGPGIERPAEFVNKQMTAYLRAMG